MSGVRRDYVAGGWTKMNYEELHNFYPSQNTVRRVIKLGMRWVEHAAYVEAMRNA
jgi:hypothetical protein